MSGSRQMYVGVACYPSKVSLEAYIYIFDTVPVNDSTVTIWRIAAGMPGWKCYRVVKWHSLRSCLPDKNGTGSHARMLAFMDAN